ncbi:hypothetical protein DY245_24075, partial [Streptomyces inhibens]
MKPSNGPRRDPANGPGPAAGAQETAAPTSLSLRARLIAVATATAVLAALAVVYTVGAARRAEPTDGASAFGLDHDRLYFRSTGAGAGRVARLPAPVTRPDDARAAAAPARPTGPDH